MTRNTYKDIVPKDLTFRDKLALERTSLANERTLLSYVRTMIGLVAVGGTLIKFFTEWYMIATGFAIITIGLLALAIGFSRFLKTNMAINTINDSAENALEGDSLQKYFYLVLQKLHIARVVN